MDETRMDEVEQSLEEGVTAKVEAPDTERTMPEKRWRSKIVLALCMLAAMALAIGLPVGLMRKGVKVSKENETLPDETLELFSLEIPNGTGKQRSLPVASFKTLKETYTTCHDLTSDLKIAVRMLANQTIESNIQSFVLSRHNDDFRFPGPILLEGGGSVELSASIDESVSSSMADSGAAGGGGITTEESSFGSNNQEEGVEEPDVVKSDGTSVYAAYGSQIVKLNVEDAQVHSRTKLPLQADKCNLDSISSMLLVDDTLVVISSGWCGEYEQPERGIAEPRLSIWRPESGHAVTRIVLYNKNTMDLKGDPKVIKGNYNSARAVGEDIYVVTTINIDYWTFTGKLSIWDQNLFGSNFTVDEYREMAALKVVDNIDAFVAQLMDDFGDCSTVQRLSLFQNEVTGTLPPMGGIMESVATVTGFGVDTPELATTKSLILPQSGWQVYSSQTQLVLATQGWWFGDGASQQTYVITYSLADAEATVIGFGTVPGYVLNQYSIDHQFKNGKDYLLLATTTRESWSWTNDDFDDGRFWEPRTSTTSQITVLEVPQGSGSESEKMEVVSKVEGLGKPGEQIYSVRFQDNRAFVVTFEQTDPFYTIDVTDPENPSKVGELEIPGFSSYLHPIGEHLILGIGQYVSTESNRQEGLQISIFDVTDFANPEQIHAYIESSGDGSGSEAEYNPMAFRYLDETGLLILPVSVYNWQLSPSDDERPFNGFKVYKADRDGISEYLRVNHETRDYHFYRYCWRNYEGNLAARSLVFSGMLWTMQGNSIQLSDLSTRVISEEPIDLDEGMEDAVGCREPIDLPPIDIFPLEEPIGEELDCSAVSCVVPECPDGPPFTPDDECCPRCLPENPDIVDEELDCAAVQCAIPLCADDETLISLPGLCCPMCRSLRPPPDPPVNTEGGPKCAAVLCARVRCADDETPITPEGECCPTCTSGNFETGLDCSVVRCAMPECSRPPFVPEGGCCPVCPDGEEPTETSPTTENP